jgi:chlorobactene glucosyltransferase
MSLLFTWGALLFISAALLIIFSITVTNARAFPRLRDPSTSQPGVHGAAGALPNAPPFDYTNSPSVVMLIPARNEAARIGATVTALLSQDYPCLQVYVLDDNSDDNTGEIAAAAAGAVLSPSPTPTMPAHESSAPAPNPLLNTVLPHDPRTSAALAPHLAPRLPHTRNPHTVTPPTSPQSTATQRTIHRGRADSYGVNPGSKGRCPEDYANHTDSEYAPLSAVTGAPPALPGATPGTTPGAEHTFHLLYGQALPPGWLGKNWACHQLAAAVTASPTPPAILIFTDADVHWEPGAVAAVVAEMQRSDADLLTVWPTQITVSLGERLTVPLMALAVLGYLPLRLAHDFYHPLAAAANGQCMAFRRAAYTAAGGHAAVRNHVVEDVRLAQRIKATGHKLRMVDAHGIISCRMYEGSRAAFDGYAKSMLGGYGNHVALLLLSTIFHWAVFLWPALWLLFGALWPLPFWPLWPLALVALGIGSRGVAAGATGQRIGDALLMPISVLLMTYVAFRAIWWRWRFGGVRWKGRILHDR